MSDRQLTKERDDLTEEIDEAEEEVYSLLRKGISIDQVVKLADIKEEIEDSNAS